MYTYVYSVQMLVHLALMSYVSQPNVTHLKRTRCTKDHVQVFFGNGYAHERCISGEQYVTTLCSSFVHRRMGE